jgi:hypothetical protein
MIMESAQSGGETPKPRKRFPWKRWLFIVVATPVVLFLLYTVTVLNWSYAKGERAGYVQKFSKKGWVFKTWEGELAMVTIPGTLAEKFAFTVRNDSVAARINGTLGKKVALVYEQHVGIPTTLFGETGYFVEEVRVLE